MASWSTTATVRFSIERDDVGVRHFDAGDFVAVEGWLDKDWFEKSGIVAGNVVTLFAATYSQQSSPNGVRRRPGPGLPWEPGFTFAGVHP